MKTFRRNLLMTSGIALSALLVLAAFGAVNAGNDTKTIHRSQLKIVTTDDDGNRNEELFEFDGEGGPAYLGVHLSGHDGNGAKVTRVMEDSAAERAGLREGDVVVAFDGESIDGPGALTRRVLSAQPGDEIELTIRRDGREKTLDAELGQHAEGGHFLFHNDFEMGELHEHLEGMGEHLEEMDFNFSMPHMTHMGEAHAFTVGRHRPKLGVQLAHTTPKLREHLGGTAETGILVSKVMEDTPAEDGGIEVGDLIVGAGGDEVGGAGDLIRALRDTDGETIELEIVRDGRPMSLDVFIPAQETSDKPVY